jgi:hypothetical protein
MQNKLACLSLDRLFFVVLIFTSKVRACSTGSPTVTRTMGRLLQKILALANTLAYCAEEAITKKNFIVLAKSVSYKTFYLGDEKKRS